MPDGEPPKRTGSATESQAPLDALELTLHVKSPAWRNALPSLEDDARRALESAIAVGKGGHAGSAVALVLADDPFVHELNLRFRGKDAPTNVLSFPNMDAACLGDIVLAYETVAAEAAHNGKAFAAHFAHLLIHGVLHLLGYGHDTDDEAAQMNRAEIVALSRLGFGNPYASPLTEGLSERAKVPA